MNTLIEFCNQLSVSWWTWSTQSTLQGAILLGLVLALVTFWRRMPPTARYALFLLVLLKFALPPVLATSIGFFAWITPQAETAPPNTAQTVVSYSMYRSSTTEETIVNMEPVILSPTLSIHAWLLLAQCLGCLSVLSFLFAQTMRLRKRLGTSEIIEQGAIHERVHDLAQRLGLRSLPRVYRAPWALSPQSGGVLHRFVVLPEWSDTLNAAEQDILLAHELGHAKRRDGLVNWLQALAQALLWWNPLVWWLNARIRAEREVCCDDLVLAHRITEGSTYSRMLVQVAERVSAPTSPLAVMAMADSFQRIDHRVRRALDTQPKRSRGMSWLSLVALLALAAWVLPGAAPATAKVDATQESTPEISSSFAVEADSAPAAPEEDAAREDTRQIPSSFEAEASPGNEKTCWDMEIEADTTQVDAGSGAFLAQGNVKAIFQGEEGGSPIIVVSTQKMECEDGGWPVFSSPVEAHFANNCSLTAKSAILYRDRSELEFSDFTLNSPFIRGMTGTQLLFQLNTGTMRIAKAQIEQVRGMKTRIEQKKIPASQIKISALIAEIDPDINLLKTLGLARVNLGDLEDTPNLGGISVSEDYALQRSKLQKLVQQEKATILAHPSLVSTNNEKASIQIGAEIPFENTSGETKFFFEGYKLDLTPSISSDEGESDMVTLVVKMKLSEFEGHQNGIPVTSSREVSSTLKMRVGNTAVLTHPDDKEGERTLLLMLTPEIFKPDTTLVPNKAVESTE
jgi:beta-lactamase regulating signal transducer with metallopeptidase domain